MVAPPSGSMSPRPLRSISGCGRKKNSVLANSRSGRENIPPVPSNVQIELQSPPLDLKKTSMQQGAPVAREYPIPSIQTDEQASACDAAVKVIVRLRPVTSQKIEGSSVARRISPDTLTVGDRIFSFNSVLDSGSTQEDVFNFVGVPLVKDSMAGFNTSLVAYGQSGTGKTYTMWGPASAMVDDPCINESQGVVPRIFQMLFSEINNIYNEQVNDLLDPMQHNHLMRDNVKHAFQVENFTEEYVNNVEDVTQLLVKGLSIRKVGATSVNSKSSRSHLIFTCAIESWRKVSSSNIFVSSRTSRIILVDLAGSDYAKLGDVGKQSILEERYIKQSLSKLGKLVNVLSDASYMERDEKVPYMDSCLTSILQDTLGGNAKATFICTIFSGERYKTGTLSTLRFGERARKVKNRAILNEISEDDVNGLSDQIRQLKEELIRAKSCGNSCSDGTDGYFKNHNSRESLNILRRSLNRTLLLPSIDNIPDDDMDVDEEDVRELYVQLENLHSSGDIKDKGVGSENQISSLTSDDIENTEFDPNSSINYQETAYYSLPGSSDRVGDCSEVAISDPEISSNLKKNNMQYNTDIHDPAFCTSPRIREGSKKRLSCSPGIHLSSVNSTSESTKFVAEHVSIIKVEPIRSSLQSNKVSPIDSLAANLQRGLQIIDYHQRNSAANKSLVSFSFEHLNLVSNKSGMEKVDSCASRHVDAPLLCSACKSQIAQVDSCGPVQELNEEVIKRNNQLQALCEEQAGIIKQLNCQIDLYKHASKQTSVFKQNSSMALEKKTSFSASKNGIGENATNEDTLLLELQSLRNQLKSCSCASANDSLLEQVGNHSITPRKLEEYESEKQRWMESESRWISITEELRLDLESNRRLAEKKELELSLEKQSTAELDDALRRSILGHARIIEHYAELQEKHDELFMKHKKVMEGIAEVKKAATKAGSKCKGSSAFAAALAAELATSRIDREKERARLKEQNRVLKIQLRDTADAVHAAGELLVRLKEAEAAVSVTEEKYGHAQQETERLKRQIEKLKKKHTMEIATMKHYLAESRLPESALEPLYHHDDAGSTPVPDEEMSWRAAFRPSYQ
ncbi:Kinesin-like protein KIN12A [Apostasia shenzhenica]|uniref:Kinesin-like protein KIN12A n=1 Tax=Apostasia shenzhenica TaxID=1088818 RepID=A0A2I0AFV5_9ASPA|nr:Kinesin-like protein KIN12A [Apostasia shenzhenica]